MPPPAFGCSIVATNATWAHAAGPWDFLPRRLYRDYILALMREALQARAGGTAFEHVRGEVTDIDTEGGCATIHVEDPSSWTR